MPKYQYRCAQCAGEIEVTQKFTDDPLTVCPECSGELRKVFSAVGVVFKGSGFYKTDSRSSPAGKSAATSSTVKPATTTSSAPAAAAPAAAS